MPDDRVIRARVVRSVGTLSVSPAVLPAVGVVVKTAVLLLQQDTLRTEIGSMTREDMLERQVGGRGRATRKAERPRSGRGWLQLPGVMEL